MALTGIPSVVVTSAATGNEEANNKILK